MKNRRKTRIIPVSFQKQSTGNDVAKELGKYLLDISKLVIGGAIITTALQFDTDKYLTIIVAVCIAAILCIAGFLVLTYKNRQV